MALMEVPFDEDRRGCHCGYITYEAEADPDAFRRSVRAADHPSMRREWGVRQKLITFALKLQGSAIGLVPKAQFYARSERRWLASLPSILKVDKQKL